MNLRSFLNLYSNWNNEVRVYDAYMDETVEGAPSAVLSSFYNTMYLRTVKEFDFIDGKLSVKVDLE